jgi:hypothetical protein
MSPRSESTKAVYALHEDGASAQRSVDSLKALGLSDDDIAVMSSAPLEGHSFFDRDKNAPISLIAVLGGIVGCVGGIALTSLTQLSWPLDTGGMPIVSIWPNLIIIFEMTMLSAILATVVALLVTARLPRRLPDFYDPEISNGKILIGVSDPSLDRLAGIERALEANGELKRID